MIDLLGQPDTKSQRGLAIVVAFAVFATLVLLNLNGAHNHIGGDLTAAPPKFNWAHGWPYYCLVRAAHHYRAADASGRIDFYSRPPSRRTSRWPIDQAYILSFNTMPLLIDGMVMILLVMGASLGADRLAASGKLGNHFSLRGLLAAVLLWGMGLQYGMAWVRHVGSQIAAYYLAMSMVALAAFLTLYGACSVIAVMLLRRGFATARSQQRADRMATGDATT